MSAEMPAAYSAPTKAPALVPTTMSNVTPASSMALIAPMCANPRAPPPPKHRAVIRLGCFSFFRPNIQMYYMPFAVFSILSVHSRTLASLGIFQAPRGENEKPTDTPSGAHERLNCDAKKRL